MTRFATGFSRSPSIDLAANELATQVEAVFADPSEIGGAFLFATAASGSSSVEIGAALQARWPGATLLGSSFEGILAEGQAWRDVPAMGVMAWAASPSEPIPLFFSPEEFDVEQLAGEVLDALGPDGVSSDDLLLLFPDSLTASDLEGQIAALLAVLGGPSVAGSAASGLVGGGCHSWIGDEVQAGVTVGLLVQGGAKGGRGERVRCAGATRFASPWLEISACRSRWVDGLEGEPPLDWVQRQLGLDARSAVDAHLDRLLIRVRNQTAGMPPPSTDLSPEEEQAGDSPEFVERYVVGTDPRRGSISLPGAVRRGGHLALALPDPDHARRALRSAVNALAPSPLVMQFACRARDESLHGDTDLEPALVAHEVAQDLAQNLAQDFAKAAERGTLGTLAPFQIGPDAQGAGRMLVYSTVLAALGDP